MLHDSFQTYTRPTLGAKRGTIRVTTMTTPWGERHERRSYMYTDGTSDVHYLIDACGQGCDEIKSQLDAYAVGI